jgi:hypothetical protein
MRPKVCRSASFLSIYSLLKSAPVVVVFTQYDRLLRTKQSELEEDDSSMDSMTLDRRSKEEAQKALGICVRSLSKTMDDLNTPMPPHVNVSSIVFFFGFLV